MTGAMARTTNGSATSEWAMGMSSTHVRRSRGGWSSAMRKPKPTMTADVPSGSITSASNVARQPAAPVADDDAAISPRVPAMSSVAITRTGASWRARRWAARTSRCAGSVCEQRLRRPRGCSRRAGERALHERQQRQAQQHGQAAHDGRDRRALATRARAAGRPPRRAQPLLDREPLLPARVDDQQHRHADHLEERQDAAAVAGRA